MRIAKSFAAMATVGVLAAGAVAVAPAASATSPELGTKSLAKVLGNDLVPGNGFDKNWEDYDIVREAIDAVIATKGVDGTPVAVLADGTVPVTAFIPNDRAFRKLIKNVTGDKLSTEKKTFNAVAGLGIDTVETVLLYHVVAGATLSSIDAVVANGASIETALGADFGIKVASVDPLDVRLRDLDPDARNARLISGQLDINAGNYQVAHGIDRVLRPLDLPKAA